MDGTYWREILRPVYEGRKFVLALGTLAGAGATLGVLRDLGAERPFIIAGGRGIGDIPEPAEAEVAMLDVGGGGSHMTWLRNVEARMADLPDDIIGRVEAWDPSGEARALGGFGDTPVANRPVYGGRPEAFVALEDKMIIDALWDRAFVPRAPSQLVRLGDPTLGRTSAELDWGHGTVWVGDNTRGWHGGAECARWVASPQVAAAAHAYLATRADVVRVMPFLEGIPCSVYGIVFEDDVVTVRPAEMLTLRRRATGELKYVGSASFYDPPDELREQMRNTAADVGSLLRAELGYAGAFTIDGVATRHGFLPTELNPRLGAGLFRAVSRIDKLWMVGLQRALLEGEPLDYRPRALEDLLVRGADQARNGRAFVMIDEKPSEPAELYVRFDEGDTAVIVDTPELAEATIEWGFGTDRGAVGIRFDPDRTPRGPSVAPRAVAGFTLAAEYWDLDIPTYEPAEDVYRG